METKTIVGIGITTLLIGGGTALFLRWRKKKKQQQGQTATTTTTTNNGGGSSSNGGVVYTGISGAQTTLLQTSLNALQDTFKMTMTKTAAQQAFLDAFPNRLDIDGKYGSKTLNAVKALQTYLNKALQSTSKNSLKIDGKYGKDTEKAFQAWATATKSTINTKIVG